MPGPTIFFSYSRKDANEFAFKLATDLLAAGASVWIDQVNIPPGRNWDEEIEKALNEAKYVLFIASEKSVSSQNVLNEIYYAVDEMKVVIPVKLHQCTIPFRIRRFQYIDFTNNYDEAFNRLIKYLELQVESNEENVAKTRDKPHEETEHRQSLIDRKPEGEMSDLPRAVQTSIPDQVNNHVQSEPAESAVSSELSSGEQENDTRPLLTGNNKINLKKILLISIGILVSCAVIYFAIYPSGKKADPASNQNEATPYKSTSTDDSVIQSTPQQTLEKEPLTNKTGSTKNAVKVPQTRTGEKKKEEKEGMSGGAVNDPKIVGFNAPTKAEGDYGKPLTKVEIESSYPGGASAWTRYLDRTLKYPQEAEYNQIQGTIVVRFIVDVDGNVSDVEAVSGPATGGLRNEAIRLIQNSGKWEPAVQNGRKVKAYKKQPITFKLEQDKGY